MKRWTPQETIEAVIRYSREMNKSPTWHDMATNRPNWFPPPYIAKKLFGSWNKMLAAAGVPINEDTPGTRVKGEILLKHIDTCVFCNATYHPTRHQRWRYKKEPQCIRLCSLHCSASYFNMTKKPLRRSKDEIQLYEMCLALWPDALANHKIMFGYDADIVIPSLMVAINWDGPWHYKDLPHKGFSLQRVQARDKKKRALFESCGWQVVSYRDDEWTPHLAMEDLKKRYPVI